MVFLTVLLALLIKHYSLVSIRNVLIGLCRGITSEMAVLWLSILKIFISLVILQDEQFLSTILLVFHCNHQSCPFSYCDCFRPSLMKVTPLHKNVLLGKQRCTLTWKCLLQGMNVRLMIIPYLKTSKIT